MIGCLWTLVRKQPIIALYFEFENELKFYSIEANTKLGLMCLAQRLNAVMPVRLEPAALRSRVKHSTTGPLHSVHIKGSQGRISKLRRISVRIYILVCFAVFVPIRRCQYQTYEVRKVEAPHMSRLILL